MKRDLFMRCKGDLEIAKSLCNSDDEYKLCVSGYLTQQAIEKCLKAVLRELGISYTKTHSIHSLVISLPDCQSFFTEEQMAVLEERAPLLTEWESHARYVEGYTVTRRALLRQLQLAEEVVSAAEKEFERRDQQAIKSAGVSKMNLF